MKFGYWTPVFGSWLRNVDDDPTQGTWEYVRVLSAIAEEAGFVLTLVPELYLNDIRGHRGDVLDAWTVATGLLTVTRSIEVLAALRPQYHQVALTAKRIATLSHMAGGRFSINLVSAWWEEEARQYGISFSQHDDRYGLTEEYAGVLRGFWEQTPYTHHGRYFDFEQSYNNPKPHGRPLFYAGGESEQGRAAITRFADKYLMHGGTVEEVRDKIADMKRRRQEAGLPPFEGFGMAVYIIVRDSEEEAQRELERITTIKNYSEYENSFKDFTGNSQLDVEISKREYSVSNRGLRSNLVGTPEQVAERIREYEQAGLGLMIVQCADMHREIAMLGRRLLPLVQ